jgi:serine/threonine protein kinase
MERSTNIGRRVGRYEILEEIGHGGMAVVYRALDTALEREVALKLLHPHLASHLESRQRFQREAKAVARLKHPAVLEIYDYSDAVGDDVYIAMELVQGTTLRRFLDARKGEPLSAEASALIIRQVGAALANAHENGVVHRDVKPENILIGPRGRIKLSDFGIAHLAGLSQMTATGQILGSPAYMSPEHIEKAELDARADIFSVGTVLYEMAVGHVPFEGKNPHAIIKRIVEGDYDDPMSVNPAVGHNLAKILRRCLALDPEKRYRKAAELVADLDSALDAMGVESEEDEPARFFDDPEKWMEKRRPEIIRRTLALGIGARRSRRYSEAMDHFNRVLALEPGNEKALSSIAVMSRHRRARRIAERVMFVAPIVIALAAVVWASTRNDSQGSSSRVPPENRSKATKVEMDTAPAVTANENKRPDAGEKDAEPASLHNKMTSVKISPPRQKVKRVVVFTPCPMAVEIVVDDSDRFQFEPSTRKRLMPIGKHKIAFVPKDRARFQEEEWSVDIPAGDTPFYFRKRLRWRPAKLFVESNVDAVVTVPGRAADRANRTFEIDIKNGPKEKISVLISAEGYNPATKQVTITAGELFRVKAPLQKRADEVSSP